MATARARKRWALDDGRSWWVGLERQAFNAEIAKREPIWRAEKKRWLDFVGMSIVGWREPIMRTRGYGREG